MVKSSLCMLWAKCAFVCQTSWIWYWNSRTSRWAVDQWVISYLKRCMVRVTCPPF